MAIQVIGARIEELLMDYVRVALADCSPQLFPGGVILSGGVAKTPGIVEMLGEVLQMKVRVAHPIYAMPPGREDTSYVSAAGLLRYNTYRNSYSHLFVEPNSEDVRLSVEYLNDPMTDSQKPEPTAENLRSFLGGLARKFKDLF